MTASQREIPHIQCADTWPPGTCSRATMDAYVELERQKQIAIQKVQVGEGSGKVIVHYTSTVPHDWIKQALRGARDGILTDAKS